MALFGKKAEPQKIEEEVEKTTTSTENDDKKNSTGESELDTLREALDKTRKEADAYKSRAERAEQEKTENGKRLTTETSNRVNAEDIAITNALAAAVADAERLEREVVEAQEDGKFSEAAKLTRQLASAQNKIDGWTAQKERFETQKKLAVERPQEPDALAGYTLKTRQWIESHPEFLTDSKYKAKAMSAHYEAEVEGIALDSPEYFKHIEDKIKGKSQVTDLDEMQEPVRKSPRTATPPSRGNNGSGMKQGNENNRLSLTEVEMAIHAWPKLPKAEAQKKYLEAREKLIAEGKIQRQAS